MKRILYHGTTDSFESFDNVRRGVIWFTDDYEYAKGFKLTEHGRVLRCEVTFNNTFDLGKINERFEDSVSAIIKHRKSVDSTFPSEHVYSIAKALDAPIEDLVSIYKQAKKEGARGRLYEVTNKPMFKIILKNAGYDSVVADEGVNSYGVVSPDNIVILDYDYKEEK